jgi:hypothetical protein
MHNFIGDGSLFAACHSNDSNAARERLKFSELECTPATLITVVEQMLVGEE